jgi:hypothetical protein
MQRNDTEERHAARFLPVFDSRKRKIRGLIRRSDKFYAQMRIVGPDGKSRPVRIPLETTSLVEAQTELEKKRTENRKGEMHLPGNRPNFEKLVADYQKSAQFLGKKLGHARTRFKHLTVGPNIWEAFESIGLGQTAWPISGRRKAQGVSARTINLDLVAFNNAMAYAVDRGWLTFAPRLKKLKERNQRNGHF